MTLKLFLLLTTLLPSHQTVSPEHPSSRGSFRVTIYRRDHAHDPARTTRRFISVVLMVFAIVSTRVGRCDLVSFPEADSFIPFFQIGQVNPTSVRQQTLTL